MNYFLDSISTSIDISIKRLYRTGVLRKKAQKKLASEPRNSPKETIMKKIIAILLILILAGFGLFAAVDNTKTDATINITALIADYSAFGVSSIAVIEDGFRSIVKFQSAVATSINAEVIMLDLVSYVDVGFLSGINNTSSAVNLSITIANLVSGTGTSSVALLVSPATAIIAPSSSSQFGTLRNTVIKVKEATAGSAALAPAGDYTSTVTIALGTI